MKKLLGIMVLGLLLSGNAYANIYSCQIIDTLSNGMSVKADLVISVDRGYGKGLITADSDNKIKRNDIIIGIGEESAIGQMIITSQSGGFLKKGNYQLYVSKNNKTGSNNYFTAIFNDLVSFETIINTITISPWDMKIYMFLSDQPRKVFKGICK
jgi:hypothetical protein